MKYICVSYVFRYGALLYKHDRVANTYPVIKTIDATINGACGCKRIRTVYNDNLRREDIHIYISRVLLYIHVHTETEVQDKSRWAVGWLGERGIRLHPHAMWVYNLSASTIMAHTICYYRRTHTQSDISFAEIAYAYLYACTRCPCYLPHVYRHRRADASGYLRPCPVLD